MSNTTTYEQYCSLNYNGINYHSKEALLSLASELQATTNNELHELSLFLTQWCNDKSYVTLQTSGSTGKPKLIQVSKAAMLASAERTIKFLNLHVGDVALLCLSVKYVAGKMMVVRALVGELKLVQGAVNSNPLVGLDQNIDFAAMVPLQVKSILKDNPNLLSKVDKLIIGGGVVHRALAQEIERMDVQTWETYGMTETVSHIAMRQVTGKTHPFRLLSDIKIAKDSRSCLIIQPSVVNESQLVTNDVVEILSNDEFILKGRFDNVINTGGIKVFPEEVELKLEKFISGLFVICSLPDDFLGQRIVLVMEGEAVNESELESAFATLKAFEKPKEVRYIHRFPLTENGKIQRVKLQQLL